MITVARITAQLKKSLKSQTIAPTTLSTYDDHFKSVMSSWPDPYPIQSHAPLDPRLLTVVFSLQSSMFILYRHNLSPGCRSWTERHDALQRCLLVAQNAVVYVQRTLHDPAVASPHGHFSPEHMAAWASRIRSIAQAFLCSFLWRCQLILCLEGDFAGAQTLVHVSAAVGDLRKSNIACGRYLSFFLDQMINRLRAGATLKALERDEEMLAYASGDMQGCMDSAWAWTGGEIGAQLRQPQMVVSSNPADRPAAQAESLSTSTLSERESQEWGGWDHVQRTLQHLIHEQQQAGVGGPPPVKEEHRTSQPTGPPHPSARHSAQAQQPLPPPPPPTSRPHPGHHHSHSSGQHHYSSSSRHPPSPYSNHAPPPPLYGQQPLPPPPPQYQRGAPAPLAHQHLAPAPQHHAPPPASSPRPPSSHAPPHGSPSGSGSSAAPSAPAPTSNRISIKDIM